MIIVPLCLSCKYFRGVGAAIGYVCEAFGEKAIPPDILANAKDHRFPVPGDRGLRYEPVEGTEAEARSVDLVSLAIGRLLTAS